MKINDQVNTVSSNLNTDATDMKIDEAGMTHIISVLTNLYEDPEMTVIREYYSNALDSHIGSGTDERIEVTAPGFYEPTFIVQDYGVGMSEHDIISIYSSYGRSTKRDSNDQVGAFGLGCKSALSYANQFSVEAVKDGMKTLAIISRKDNGGTEYSIVGTTQTDDPNGVRISIPVANYESFNRKMQEFFRYADPDYYTIDNLSVSPFKNDFHNVGDNLWVDTSNRSYGSGGLAVLMGGVRYPVSNTYANELFEETGVKFGYGSNLLVEMPIGSVDLTPSRESLQETQRTKKAIKKIYTDFIEDSFVKIQAEVDSADNIVMAKFTVLSQLLTYGFIREYDLGHQNNLKNISGKFTYNGEAVEEFKLALGNDDNKGFNYGDNYLFRKPQQFFSGNYSVDKDSHSPSIDYKYLLIETSVQKETFERWTDRRIDVGLYTEYHKFFAISDDFELSEDGECLDTTRITFDEYKKEIVKAEKKLNMTPQDKKANEPFDSSVLRNTDVIIVSVEDGERNVERISVKDLDEGTYTSVRSGRSKSDFKMMNQHISGIKWSELYTLTHSHDLVDICTDLLEEMVIIRPSWYDESKTPEGVKFKTQNGRDDFIDYFVKTYTKSRKKREIIREIFKFSSRSLGDIFNNSFIEAKFVDPKFKAIQKDVKFVGVEGLKIAEKASQNRSWSGYGSDRFTEFFDYVRDNYGFLSRNLNEIRNRKGVAKMFNIMYTENIKEEK